MKEIYGILHQKMLKNITKKPMTTPKVLRAVSSQGYVLPRFSVFIQMSRWQSPSGFVEETGQYSEGHGGAAKSWAGGQDWWSVSSGKRSHYTDVGVGHRYWIWQETDYANQGTTCMYTNNDIKYRQRLIILEKKIIWKLAQLKSFNEIIYQLNIMANISQVYYVANEYPPFTFEPCRLSVINLWFRAKLYWIEDKSVNFYVYVGEK